MWRKGAGKRSLECGGKLPESDVWIVEGGCRIARPGERMMSESVVWGADGCRNAKFRSGRIPEYEAWVVEERC